MAYYQDLTPYNYHHHSEKELNIGWLQKDQEFTKGYVPEGFLERLKWFNERPFTIHHTRGWHGCDFCDAEKMSGSHELRIVGADNKVYACPELIIHYVEAHNYLPPQEFIDAVMNGPRPGQDKYTDIIKLLPESWERKKSDPNEENFLEKMQQVMVDGLTTEIDAKILKDIMEQNPALHKFLEGYKEIMPSVYKVNLDDKNKKS